MNCEGVRERLSGYIDGELDDLSFHQVRSHLQRCPACAAEEAQLRSLVALLRQVARATEVPVPSDFRSRLRSRLLQLPPPLAQTARPPGAARWRRWGLPAAAAAAVAAGFTLLVGPGALRAPAGDPGARAPVATPAVALNSGSPGLETPGQPETGVLGGQAREDGSTGVENPGQGSAAPGPGTQGPGGATGGSPGQEAPGQQPGQQPGQPNPGGAPRPDGGQPETGSPGPVLGGPARIGDGSPPGDGNVVTATPGEGQPEAAQPAPTPLEAVTYRTRIRAPLGPGLETRLAQVMTAFPEARRIGDPTVTAVSEKSVALSYTFAVPRGQAEAMLTALEALGEPVQRSVPEVVSLAAEYEARAADLAAKRTWLEEKERELQDPRRSELNRESLKTDIERVRQEIPILEQELAQMWQRAQQAWIVLTVEGPRTSTGE
ncbi:MAG: zf-HC2 domain-containing protein [Firmicutes bacterium]|nr:zf-HC2 domain-containing protein [Bacillota bacterium]